jgi:hypothetical protein
MAKEDDETQSLKNGINLSVAEIKEMKKDSHSTQTTTSTLRLFFVSLWTLGTGFGFNAEFALGTPLFENLG